ncbi:hypothetical protein [Janibacter melonis]|uniref:hypothetical protein n=1 Tax=Janibacter melonis TaxID=262209 RepID=UPI00191A3CCC|nr:hypothetical protein [Janibacter melonis]
MSTSLHDALAELADDIVPEDVPGGLAESAWSTARVERRRSLSRRSVALLAAAAVTVLLAWVSFGGVSRVDTLPAAPTGPVGYPERVRFQADPPQLPLRSGPVAGLISVGTKDDADDPDANGVSSPTVNGGSATQAVLPSGELRSLDDVIPAGDLRPDQASEILDPVALSPDGTKIAAVRHTATVLTRSSTRDSTYVLHVHDLRSGQHHVVDGRAIGLNDEPQNVVWSPDGKHVAIRTSAKGEGVAVVTAAGRVVAQVDRATSPNRPRSVASLYLAGWTDDDTVLLVTHAQRRSLYPSELDVRTGRLEHLPRQPANDHLLTYVDGSYIAPGDVTVHQGALAVLGLVGDDPTWTLYTDVDRPDRSPSAVACCPGAGGEFTDRRLYSPGGGMLAVGDVDGTRVVAGSFSFEGGTDDVRTVVDPSLRTSDMVVAEEVYARGRASSSLLGTWDLWVIWHPWWTALGVAGAGLVLWWMLRDSTWAVRPPWRGRQQSRA